MEQVLYSVRAGQDADLIRKGELSGFGLVSGSIFGRAFVVDRFQFIGSRYRDALEVYRKLDSPAFCGGQGIFSTGITELPEIEHCGLFLRITRQSMVPYFCSIINGTGIFSVKACQGVVEWKENDCPTSPKTNSGSCCP